MHDPQAIVGRTISGKYMVRRLLGQGGMGAVYEGQNIEIGKRVAIKMIDQAHSMSQELTSRLRREARAASSVESAHIVQVFDVGEDPTCGVYMVMEYLQGEDLSTKLQRETKLDPKEAAHIAHQIARALVKAHAGGIVHRDLKPANIFLTEKEEGGLLVKVLDFGISKLLNETVTPEGNNKALTRLGTALGTPQYMSPEQAQGLPNIDHKTDIWALGGVLYEMLAGRAPYDEGPSYEMTIVKILTTRPPPLISVAPWVPAGIAQLVDSALEHDHGRRLADAVTFVKALSQVAAVDLSMGTGRFSVPSTPSGGHDAIRISPHYASPPGTMVGMTGNVTGNMPVQQRPPTPMQAVGVDLSATIPMDGSANYDALVNQARAALQQLPSGQHQITPGPSGQHQITPGQIPLGPMGAMTPRKPISTGTAMAVPPGHTGTIAMPQQLSEPPLHAAGVPAKRSGGAIFAIAGVVLAMILVWGGLFYYRAQHPAQPEEGANAAPAEPTEPTEPTVKKKAVKPKETATAEPEAPAPPPTVKSAPVATVVAPVAPAASPAKVIPVVKPGTTKPPPPPSAKTVAGTATTPAPVAAPATPGTNCFGCVTPSKEY